MGDEDGFATALRLVKAEDSPDARRFIEISSIAADLAEAEHALELALEGEDQDSPLAEAQHYLVGYAVVAYSRAMTPSKVRRPLTEYMGVPVEFQDIHQTIVMFRNRTVAHSHSDVAVTYVMGVLDADSHEVRDVMAPTIVTPLPRTVVREFRRLVTMMLNRVDEALVPFRTRLADQLRAADMSERLSRSQPQVFEKLADDFDARTKRSRYPTSHTLYWVRDDIGDPTEEA